MAELRDEFLKSVHGLVGRPFNTHYLPEDPCYVGDDPDYLSEDMILTDPRCMERGLDEHGEGLDCMAVGIVAMCRVLGIRPRDWPVIYRHLQQLAGLSLNLGSIRTGKIGDVALLRDFPGGPICHMGVLVAENVIVHATYLNEGMVEPAKSSLRWAEFISPEVMAAIPPIGE